MRQAVVQEVAGSEAAQKYPALSHSFADDGYSGLPTLQLPGWEPGRFSVQTAHRFRPGPAPNQQQEYRNETQTDNGSGMAQAFCFPFVSCLSPLPFSLDALPA